MNALKQANPRIGFVVQRAGAEVNGGAESHCLQVALRMGRHWNTEVLTTCALDFSAASSARTSSATSSKLTALRLSGRFSVMVQMFSDSETMSVL